MKMNKKGAEMSMSIIVVAVIVLLVLVVISVIFMGRMGQTRKTLETCSTNGGSCTDVTVGCVSANYEKEITGVCFQADQKTVDTTKVCCVKV